MQKAVDIRVAPNGRMVLPKAARKALGVDGAGVIALCVEGDEVTLTSMASSIKRAQALYRTNVKTDLPSDALLKERRDEAERDRVAKARD